MSKRNRGSFAGNPVSPTFTRLLFLSSQLSFSLFACAAAPVVSYCYRVSCQSVRLMDYTSWMTTMDLATAGLTNRCHAAPVDEVLFQFSHPYISCRPQLFSGIEAYPGPDVHVLESGPMQMPRRRRALLHANRAPAEAISVSLCGTAEFSSTRDPLPYGRLGYAHSKEHVFPLVNDAASYIRWSARCSAVSFSREATYMKVHFCEVTCG